MASLINELEDLITAFDVHGIEYAVCGGIALTIHGFARATFDIDVLIRSESLETAFKAAAELGYDIHGPDISFKERAVEIRRVSKIDDEGEVLPLDLLLVTPFVEDVWETREQLEWNDRALTVVSIPGLVKMKQLAGRAKDLIDIERMTNEED